MVRLAKPVDNARFVEIIRGHFDFDAVSDGQTDETFSHFAGNVSEHDMTVLEFDAKHRPGQNRLYRAFRLDVFFHPFCPPSPRAGKMRVA